MVLEQRQLWEQRMLEYLRSQTIDDAGRAGSSAARLPAWSLGSTRGTDPGSRDGQTVSAQRRLQDLVPAPAVVLAAGAARTERIRLTSAVSVISSDRRPAGALRRLRRAAPLAER